MSSRPHVKKQKPKPRPRSRPRLFVPSPLPLAQSAMNAQWSPQPLALEELLMDYSLPQIVQCRTPILRPPGDRSAMPISMDTPILLVRQHSARYLLARVVEVEQRGRAFTESGDSVVIPEDYEGHFLRLDCRTTKDKSRVRSLEAVVNSDTAAFVNLSNITSHSVNCDPRDRSHLIYTMGNVFLVDDPSPPPSSSSTSEVASERTALSSAATSAVSRGSRPSASGRGLLRCVDERGTSIRIPTNQKAEVVAVKKNADGSSKLSMRAAEILAVEKFPVVIRFAYGERPLRLATATRLFTLLDSFQETSLIGCAIDRGQMTMLEIPLMSSLQFQVAMNRDELLGQPALDNIFEACHARCPAFARDIKFKYKFVHKVQRGSPRMMKLHEDDLPSATVRTRLDVTESYVYV